MERSLETCEGLKSLIFHSRPATIPAWRTYIWNSLCLRAKDSLEILCFSLSVREELPWASLAEFTKLKHLHFRFHEFEQSNDDAVLAKTLPRSLQSLYITVYHRYPGRLIPQIRYLIEHATTKTPILSSITLGAATDVCKDARCLVAPCLETGISFHFRPPILTVPCECRSKFLP